MIDMVVNVVHVSNGIVPVPSTTGTEEGLAKVELLYTRTS